MFCLHLESELAHVLSPDTQDGQTAVFHMAAKGNAECLAVLIDRGANVNAAADVRSPD